MRFTVSQLLAVTFLTALCLIMCQAWALLQVPAFASIIPLTITSIVGICLIGESRGAVRFLLLLGVASSSCLVVVAFVLLNLAGTSFLRHLAANPDFTFHNLVSWIPVAFASALFVFMVQETTLRFRKGKRKLPSLLVLGMMLFIVAFVANDARPGRAYHNKHLVKTGMQRGTVEAILGPPNVVGADIWFERAYLKRRNRTVQVNLSKVLTVNSIKTTESWVYSPLLYW